MNIIIIEDEPATAKDLKSILENLDEEITVLAILSSVAQAVNWLKTNPEPELIFSDIQLGDGLSFEIFKEIQVQAPVIFCTAFDEYAIQAFESNSIDYLLKPLEEEMVERSLHKYQRIKDHYNSTYAGNFNKVLDQLASNYKQSLLVHYREKIIPIKVSDIGYICVVNGTVALHTITTQVFFLQYTIDQLEGILNPHLFFRANRQFIINRSSIENIEHYFNRRLLLKLNQTTPTKILISRLKAQDFLHWMEQ